MILFTPDVDSIDEVHLDGFFFEWSEPLTRKQHLAVLRGSDHVLCAVDEEDGRVVGFITAVTDGVLSAYIPLLEVRRDYRGRGIGTELVRMMMSTLRRYRMVDVVCDEEVAPFYRRFGFSPCMAMIQRRSPGEIQRG